MDNCIFYFKNDVITKPTNRVMPYSKWIDATNHHSLIEEPGLSRHQILYCQSCSGAYMYVCGWSVGCLGESVAGHEKPAFSQPFHHGLSISIFKGLEKALLDMPRTLAKKRLCSLHSLTCISTEMMDGEILTG